MILSPIEQDSPIAYIQKQLGHSSIKMTVDVYRHLARISHQLATATADASTLTAFRSVGLLDVLHEYDCGGLGRKPCQSGASTVSLRKLMRNAG